MGIKSVFIIFLAYAYCGLRSGLAGPIASSRIYSADAKNIGLNMEMDAILAVVFYALLSSRIYSAEYIGPNGKVLFWQCMGDLGGGKFLTGRFCDRRIYHSGITLLLCMQCMLFPIRFLLIRRSVVIIVALQSPGFAGEKSLLQKKEMAAGKEAA